METKGSICRVHPGRHMVGSWVYLSSPSLNTEKLYSIYTFSHSLAFVFTHSLVSFDIENFPGVTQSNLSFTSCIISALWIPVKKSLSPARSWTYFLHFHFKVVLCYLTQWGHIFTWSWLLLQTVWCKGQDKFRMGGYLPLDILSSAFGS